MTAQILFSNGCNSSICARYGVQIDSVYTTDLILQGYLDDHRHIEWMKNLDLDRFIGKIVGAEVPLAIYRGKWNDSGWDGDGSLFDEKNLVKKIPHVNLNWNYR